VSGKKRPHVATPDEVRIARDGDYAVISYLDDTIETTQYRIGADRLSRMADEDILVLWNAGLATQEDAARSRRDMTALVSSLGTLSCVVKAYPNQPNQPFLEVDGRLYTAMEVAHLLGGHVGCQVTIQLRPAAAARAEPVEPPRTEGAT
jgi:hypothetical protein